MAGPNNNTANALNDSFDINSQFVNEFGSWIGTIADWAGAFAGISGLVGTIIGLLSPSSDPLKPIEDEIKAQFALLDAVVKAQNIIDRWNSTNTELADAEDVLEALPTLASGPPLDSFQIANQLELCTHPLNALGVDLATGGMPAWTAAYLDQVYWTDSGLYILDVWNQDENNNWVIWDTIDTGYGLQAPPQPPKGPQGEELVFHYRFVFPTYLSAVAIFTVVGKTIDPQFTEATGYASTIRDIASLLSSVHDKIFNVQNTPSEGMIELSPGPWTTAAFWNFLTQQFQGGPYIKGVIALAWDTSNTASEPLPMGAIIEYGAVETFSGYSAVGNYTLDYSVVPSYSDDTSLYQKFQLRLLAKKKAVYAGVGLATAWNTINKLKTMVGDPVLSGLNFADWSFRELFQVSGIGPQNDGSLHLGDLANLLLNTPPSDTASNILSFRNLLTPVS